MFDIVPLVLAALLAVAYGHRFLKHGDCHAETGDYPDLVFVSWEINRSQARRQILFSVFHGLLNEFLQF